MSTQQLPRQVTAAGSGIGRATGFELASPGQPAAANVEAALERNRAFAAAGGQEGAVVFPKLRLFVITCLDPRTDPAYFLGLGLSDAMVVQGDVGGRVTPEVINDVAFIGQLAETALPDGPLFEVLSAAELCASPVPLSVGIEGWGTKEEGKSLRGRGRGPELRGAAAGGDLGDGRSAGGLEGAECVSRSGRRAGCA